MLELPGAGDFLPTAVVDPCNTRRRIFSASVSSTDYFFLSSTTHRERPGCVCLGWWLKYQAVQHDTVSHLSRPTNRGRRRATSLHGVHNAVTTRSNHRPYRIRTSVLLIVGPKCTLTVTLLFQLNAQALQTTISTAYYPRRLYSRRRGYRAFSRVCLFCLSVCLSAI